MLLVKEYMSEDMPQGKQTVSDSQIIMAIKNHDDPFVRSKEIADIFEHSRQWAHERLDQLEDDDLINKKGSSKSVIWWVE